MASNEDDVARVVADIGARISELRRRRGWTQREIAERIPMHLAQYRHLEQGRADVRVSTLRRVAVALGLPLASLFRKPGAPRPRARRVR